MSTKKNNSYLVLAIGLLISIFAAFYASKLKFSYEFEDFFPNDNEELSVYNKYRNKFEHDNEFVLIGIENTQGIFKKEFLLKIDSLTKELRKIQDVKSITSPTNINEILLGGILPVKKKLLRFESPEFYEEDSIKIYTANEYVGSIFPKNGKSVCLYVKTTDKLSKIKSDSLSKQIKRKLNTFNFEKYHFVGRIIAQEVYLEKLQKEFFAFMSVSFLIVVVFLIIAFRSRHGVIIPVIIILISILWTLGFMGATSKSIDIMTVMLPTMIFITGMSDVVHYMARFYEEREKGHKGETVFQQIRKDVGFPTFLTLVSTLVGFLSLLFSSIKPVKEFGIYTSVGITIAFILTYTLLPAILRIFPPLKIYNQFSETNSTYGKMRSTLFWIFKNQKKIVVVTLLICVICVLGIMKIQINHVLLEDLSDDLPVKKDFSFFDKNYSGVRPFELWIRVKPAQKDVWNFEVIKEIDKIDNYLKNEYGIGFLLSPAQIYK
ncbi:MAG: efflux RND transporter permease subunit, partial [Bacteroidota bacterium]